MCTEVVLQAASASLFAHSFEIPYPPSKSVLSMDIKSSMPAWPFASLYLSSCRYRDILGLWRHLLRILAIPLVRYHAVPNDFCHIGSHTIWLV
jgi:hypothetical protein